MQKTTQQEMQTAIAASDLYQLLAMWLQLPTREIAAGLLNGSLAEDVLAIFDELGFPAHLQKGLKSVFSQIQEESKSQEELFSDLRKEYTRLFTHPKQPQIHIYESLFLFNPEGDEARPSLFISPAALDAERCYKKAGVARAKEVNEPGDHMATEMEFMMFLYLQKAKALQEGDRTEVERRGKEIQEFYEIHLQKWAKEFFARCSTLSEHPFFKTVGEIGSIFMKEMLPAH
ncbi:MULTISPECIES: molecular chaperone [Desulfitobacterium]|uniref:Putative component of anaerobic dehydrogenase n=1 Tax=Desulfitobacterium dehalogenans (strain ATCC 51507 / DSM 9161 / JW/IU-DC1) TaxID=756499 RepID=I4A8V4_DESDJ|nr:MULTISPECIES: molecular chaperone TorD family protein [Desulfitobacterium]AFM00389.1 putative component of anaerobic dehydrogenase [Desulfitobacterium dehalogenans ATCC 51507]